MSVTEGLSKFQLSFEISPIILNGGIAENVPGGMIPIISLMQPQDFSKGLLSAGDGGGFDDTVAHFTVMAGGTLIENQVGQYPFANQFVAANAIIVEPLHISLMMVAPAPSNGGYAAKQAAFSSLVKTLGEHNISGGTYTIATPAYLYTDCLLLALRDITSGDQRQVQAVWQWDFYQPLVTQAAAAAAQNSLVSKMTAKTKIEGDPPAYSGTANAVGGSTSGVGPALVPAAKNPVGSSVGTRQGGPSVKAVSK